MAGPLRIVTVCEGNICRSPLAEQLLASRLAAAGIDAQVSSAGLGAMDGAPMDATAAELSASLGGDPSSASSSQLRSSIVDGSDLLLTMTRDQRDELVRRYPRAMRRTFTVTEFEKLLAEERSGPLDELPTRLASVRSRVRLAPGDDVQDPYRRSRAVHEAVAAQLDATTASIVERLRVLHEAAK